MLSRTSELYPDMNQSPGYGSEKLISNDHSMHQSASKDAPFSDQDIIKPKNKMHVLRPSLLNFADQVKLDNKI